MEWALHWGWLKAQQQAFESLARTEGILMKKQWEYKYPSRMFEAMVSEDHVLIGDELFFVHMTNGRYPNAGVYGVNVATGEARTVLETNDFLRTIGASDGQAFFFTSLRGNAYCVTSDGTLRWERQLGEKTGSASWDVALDGDRLYMAQDALYCLNPQTGETVWASQKHDALNRVNAFLAEGTRVYCAMQGSHLYCADKDTGKTVWTYEVDTWWRNVVSFDSHTLLCTDTHGRYLFLDKHDGHLIHEAAAGGRLMRRPVPLDGTVLVGENPQSPKGRLVRYAVGDSHQMKPLFEVPAIGAVTSEPVVVGDRVLFGTEDGSVYCVHKDTGEELEKKRKVKGACRGIVPLGEAIVALSDKGPATAFSLGK